jgi:hypothetical protein
MGNFGTKIIKIGWAVQKLWPFRWAKSGWFSVFFHTTPTGVYNTSFWSISLRIHYYRRKHDNLLGSENNIFWSKNVIFLTFFQKTENQPLLAHRKGHNFWTAQPILIIFVPKFPILYVSKIFISLQFPTLISLVRIF